MENNESESKFPELVAYLDGELASEDRRVVESRLASDREYRHELAQLQKSWDMLDMLPSVQVSEDFTQSTVEMAAISVETLRAKKQSATFPLGKLLAVLLLIAAPAAAFYLGYWKTQKDLNANNLETQRDLDIIRRLPIYRSVNADLSPEKSIQFLEMLVQEDQNDNLFISVDENRCDALISKEFETPIRAEDLNDQKMEAVKLEELADYKKRFDSLGSQKDNLRKFHNLLNEHPQRERLIDELARYHVWFRDRVFLSSQQEIDLLKDASPEDRLNLVRDLESDHYRNSFRFVQRGRRIPAIQDYKKIKAFGREILGNIRDEFIERLASAQVDNESVLKEMVQELRTAPSDHHFFALMMRYAPQIYGDDFVNPFFDPRRIRPFISELSDESKEKLQNLDDQTRFIIVQLWIISTLGNIDNSELAQFEDKVLSGKQRSSLNQLNNYQKKREILTKAFFYTLEPLGVASRRPELPDDLMELANWTPFPEPRRPQR